ncbi:MAG: DUF883 domain-containing protein [Tatlockia sp.]|jgi:ElaB/YqjD/DUF883 family membrane-anchored ribosome-binding protein
MEKSNTPRLNGEKEKLAKQLNEAKEQGEHLYEHMKDKASHLVEEGKKTVCEAEECMKEYGDELIQFVKEKPIAAVLIAGGLGFILSSLLKK